MEQVTFGKWLRVKRRLAGYRTQHALAVAADLSEKSIRNYELDKYEPPVDTRAVLEQLLGSSYQQGDPVEAAVKASELDKWRQTAVLSVYEKHLQEQRDGPSFQKDA